MLFLHEVHEVVGLRNRDFEAAIRDEWSTTLAKSADARLLWYAHQAHGSGPAYTVVTITGFATPAAWHDVALRLQRGDLRDFATELDRLRHDTRAKLLLPTPQSPLQAVDLDDVPLPSAGETHEPAMFMEDTGWPHEGLLDEYVAALGEIYTPMTKGSSLIEVQAIFQPAYGSGRRREAILWQRLGSDQALLRLLTHEEPPSYPEDSWMTRALRLRDQWRSRLLRTAPWSPLS